MPVLEMIGKDVQLCFGNRIIKILLISMCMLFTSQTLNAQKRSWVKKVGARTGPSNKTAYSVASVTDSTLLCTEVIQKMIDECAAAGGGVVTFQPGVYLTGSLFIKNGVKLNIPRGVKIKGSEDIKDYPEIPTRIAGIEMQWPAALINVIGGKNICISGNGLIHAQGKIFWEMYWTMRKAYEINGLCWALDFDAKRPRTILVAESSDVTLKGLTLQQAAFWTVQVLYSNHITIDGLLVQNNMGGEGPNTDGIDIDSSSWVLIQDCDIDSNDDNFSLKAGRDWDGLRVNRPTEYVVIRRCMARRGGGLLSLGSETSGGIRHVLATDLRAYGTKNALNIKSALTRGGTIEDIYFENIAMDSIGTFLEVNMDLDTSGVFPLLPESYASKTIPKHWTKMLTKVEPAKRGIPVFRNVFISNVKVQGARIAINAHGQIHSCLTNFKLRNVDISTISAGAIRYASGWNMENVKIKADDMGAPEVLDGMMMNVPWK